MKSIKSFAAKIAAVLLAVSVCFSSMAFTTSAATSPYLFYLVYSDLQMNKTSADQRYGANSNHINSQQLTNGDSARGIKGSVVYLAKNEREGFQIYFHEQTASRPLRVEVGEFRNEKGELLESSIYNEAYFRPWANGDQLGEALVPYRGETVTTVLNENNTFYVELISSKDQTPGNYTSKVTLYDGDKVLEEKPITAVVWNFALPESHYATALMGLYNSASSYGDTKGFLALNGVRFTDWSTIVPEDIPLAESILEGWQETMLEHGITPYELPRFMIDNDEKAAELTMADPRRKMFSVPLLSGNILSSETKEKILQYKNVVNGNPLLMDKAFFYVADEPGWGEGSDTSAFDNRVAAIESLWPNSHKMVPFFNSANFEIIMSKLKTSTDVLCLNQGLVFGHDGAFDEYANGDSWHIKLRYPGDIQLGSFELWRWGKSPAGVFRRIFFWQSDLLGDNGMLYYNCGYVPQTADGPYNIWETYTMPSASGVQTGNGNGVLLYPGAPIGEDPTKPIVSLRLKQISAGLDDNDYLTLAREFLGEDSQVLKNAINKVFVNYEKYGLQYIFSSEPHDNVSVDYIAWECATMNAARIMLGNALSEANTEHNYGKWMLAVEPDADHDGLEIRTCADCGTQESRAAVRCSDGEHSYTYTDNCDGTHTCQCTVCGSKIIQEHRTEDIPDVEPTCTSEGLTGGVRCKDCGLILEPQSTVDKIPHTPGDWNYASNGVFERECSVCHNIIDVQTVEITLSDSSITLTNGDSAQLTAEAADFTKIVFSSENSAIASVDSKGKITAKSPGETAIIARIEGTDIEKACKVTVNPKTYTVTWIIDSATQTTKVAEGAAIVPPEVKDIPGYKFKGWSPDIPDKMPSENLTFTATFEPVSTVSIVPVNSSDEKSGDVIYHQVPWYETWVSHSVDLTVQMEDNSKIASVQWVYANWSAETPEADILYAGKTSATIRPTWGIGARSCWVQAIVTDIYGNKITSDPVKVRFYNWDWQK